MSKLPRRTGAKSKIDTGKIAKLIRLLGSDKPGEVIAAAAALKRMLAASGKDLHDLAAAAVAGLRPAPPQRQVQVWGPPAPRPGDWQSMCWYLHHHRLDLRPDDRAFVEDCLLGRFEGGVVRDWHLTRLRGLVAIVQRGDVS